MNSGPTATPSGDASSPERHREVRYELSRDFVGVLQELGVSLLVSTYQAGKLVVLGTTRSGLHLSFHNFQQAMGVGVHADQLAVGAQNTIWFLRSAPHIARQLEPAGQFDACYLARSCHVTDEIHVHEMNWAGDTLWFVNTRFSCLCTLHEDFSFVPQWKPRFITALAAEDRCHLNGLAMENGQPLYVTTMSETDTAAGWRPVKATDGCLIHVPSNETVSKGFAMPHSPRVYGGRLWVLDSGRGQLVTVDPKSGQRTVVSEQPGYARGLAFVGPYAFIGLSKVRETSTFGGVPIAANPADLKCAVAVVDLRIGRRVAYFEFLSGVEEIFDVQVLPGIRCPHISGPLNQVDGTQSIWVAPTPEELAAIQVAHRPPTRPAAVPAPVPAQQSSLPSMPFAHEASDEVIAYHNRGGALMERDELEEAVECFRSATQLAPDFASAHCNLGVTLQFLGRLDESRASLQRAIELKPDLAAAHFNLSMTLFLMGEWQRAWGEYEWRWQCAKFGKRPVAASAIAPAWDGSPLAGKTILVYGEQGIGDEIMFASCLEDLIRDSSGCIVACEHRLVDLFARSFPQSRVVSIEDIQDRSKLAGLGPIDFQVACASVPRFTGVTADSVPRRDRFLLPDPAQAAVWKERVDGLGGGLKVGVSWRGGSGTTEVRRRSIELEQWKPILTTPNVRFVNLQYGDRTSELQRVEQQLGVAIQNWPEMEPLRDMDGFAALVANLDLVISIDNSTVHVAGSLGVPTWMLVSFPSSSYWRWPLEGDRSVWYSSLQFFRKQRTEDWQPTLELAARKLHSLAT